MELSTIENRCIGLSVEEAEKLAEANGYSTRIVREDGESFIVHMDLRTRRLNFQVEKGVVVSCEIY